jgi:hypothetical protein
MTRSRLTDWNILCDTVDPKQLELQAAKEMLAEVYDIQIYQVDEIIRQRITESHLLKREIKLCADYRRSYHS